MERINRWMIQEGNEGNYIIYPIPFFPIKGYVAPDEDAAIRFTNRMYPILGLGFGILMFAGRLGEIYSLIAIVLYFVSLIIINLNFVKNFPVTKKKYSWKQYADEMNERISNFFISFAWFGTLLFSCLVIIHFIIFGDKRIEYYIFAMSISIYAFYIYSMPLFYRIKSIL